MPEPKLRGGVYQFRKRVPKRLIALVGKTEEKVSLETDDPVEARIRYAAAERNCLKRWRTLEAGVVNLTAKQCRAIGGELFRRRVAEFEDHVLDPVPWREEAERRAADLSRLRAGSVGGRIADAATIEAVSSKPILDAFLESRGIVPTQRIYVVLLQIATDSLREAALHLEQAALGNYQDPNLRQFPPLTDLTPNDGRLHFQKVWEEYIRETGIAPATRKRWFPVLVDLCRFAGTEDLALVTRTHIVDWKSERLRNGLSAGTVKNVYVAAAKTLFGYLAENGRIETNPAGKVVVRVPKTTRTREQGFTRDEAFLILDKTLSCGLDRASPDRVGLVRWVPWLCAYTGARVNEITQMRPIDLRQLGGRAVMIRITPEAGTTKTASYRDVALHPHLIAQGFIGYVLERGDRPLFFDPARTRGGDHTALSKKAGERLAAWVREIGVTDKRIRPNHAWRNRFKTLSRAVGMRDDFSELILGHAPEGASRAYGNYWAALALQQIEMLPPYDLPDLELLSAEEAGAQVAQLAKFFRSSHQQAADMEAIAAWRARFRMPELPMPTSIR